MYTNQLIIQVSSFSLFITCYNPGRNQKVSLICSIIHWKIESYNKDEAYGQDSRFLTCPISFPTMPPLFFTFQAELYGWMTSQYPSSLHVKGRIFKDITLDYKLYEDRDQVCFILQNNTSTLFESILLCYINDPHCLCSFFFFNTISRGMNTVPIIILQKLIFQIGAFQTTKSMCCRLRTFTQWF